MYIFHIRYNQEFAAAHPLKVKLEFSKPVDAAVGLTGYAFLLTYKVKSTNSDGERHSDLV